MNDWVSKTLIALFLAMLLMQQYLDFRESCHRSAKDCAGGGCGNLLSLQERLERNTIRFSQPQDAPLSETAR